MTQITCPVNSSLCGTLEEAGAGIGVFLQYLVIALPTLLLVLAVIGGFVAIFYAIASVIKNAVSGAHRTK